MKREFVTKSDFAKLVDEVNTTKHSKRIYLAFRHGAFLPPIGILEIVPNRTRVDDRGVHELVVISLPGYETPCWCSLPISRENLRIYDNYWYALADRLAFRHGLDKLTWIG